MKQTTNEKGVTIKLGQLVKAVNRNNGEVNHGVVDQIVRSEYSNENKVYAYWNDEKGKADRFYPEGAITEAHDIIVYPVYPVPTKPYEQLVAYDSRYGSGRVWGVYVKTENGKVYATWNLGGQHDGGYYINADRIVAMHDIVVHPKSPMEQAADAAKDAIQGLINAAAQKIADDARIEVEVKPTFSFADFDASAARTWKDQGFDAAIQNAALGLTGEAGEVADLVKKAIHHKRGFAEIHTLLPEEEAQAVPLERLIDELGDILYYVSVAAQTAGSSLQEVAEKNKDKLEKRFPEGFTPEAAAAKADREPTAEPFDGEVHDGCKMVIRDTCFHGEFGLDFKDTTQPFDYVTRATFTKQKKTPVAGLSQMVIGETITFPTAHEATVEVTKVGQDTHNILFIQLGNHGEELEKVLFTNATIEVTADASQA